MAIMSSPPFIDVESGELDLGQIWDEAFRLAGLVILFGAAAFLVFLLTIMVGETSPIALFLTVFVQFILAIGIGVVLIYIVARGIQLAEE